MPIYKMDGKKDGKQKYRVRINYQYAMGKDRQIDRVAYGHDEAKMLEIQLRQNLKDETHSKSMTVQQLYDEYVEAKKHEVRESTLIRSKEILEYHVLPEVGKIKLNKLNVAALQKWKLGMENKETKGNKKLALQTKKNAFGEFHTLMNYAVKMEYISKNPLSKIDNFKSSIESKKEMDFYTADEFKKFIKAARKCAQQAEERHDLSEWHYCIL